MKRLAAATVLLLLGGCKPLPELPGASAPYAQVEAGLALVFVDPELKGADQFARRLQVRVDRSFQAEDGSLVVSKEMLQGVGLPLNVLTRVSKGGVALLDEHGKPVAQLLPEGFPDRTSSWEAHGTRFVVLGRAAWGGASILPDTSDPVGVWVEARPSNGPRSRSLYLKGLGEVETLEERPGGAWVCVNRLEQYGFPSPSAPDPALTLAPVPASKPAAKPAIKPAPARAKRH